MLNDLKNRVLNFRKDLNKIAELSWKEFKTRDYIVGQLGKDFVWSDKTALVYKIGEGTPVFFRAELDALDTSLGPKHVCGHSAHMAALMGAYLYLQHNPIKNFSIYFVFQPSEESYPSGADFVFKKFLKLKNCKAGFAFHVLPKYKAGELVDPTFAFADYFEVTVKGKSTHIKYKNESKLDALLVGAEILQAINKKRNKDWIINAGVFSGGDTPNKIAGEARLSGDVRGFDQKYSKLGREVLKKLCDDARKKYPGINISLYYNPSCQPFKNDPKIGAQLKKVLSIKNSIKSFGTEDFSHYMVKRGFTLIGTGRKEELHSNDFIVPDNIVLKVFDNWIKISQNLSSIIE